MSLVGSPPRAWGQCTLRDALRALSRFTPTGVGTMPMSTAWCATGTVHPHGRGDNDDELTFGDMVRGSPPRAWGQFNGSEVADEDVRFTPTGVGTIRG